MTRPEPPGPAPAAGRSLAASSGVLLGARLGINLGYFVAAITLAHLLRPTERGAVAFITVTALVVSAASRMGIDDATSVFAARNVERRPALLANVLLAGAVSSAMIGGATSAVLLTVPHLRPADVHTADLALLLLGGMASSIAICGSGFLIGCRKFLAWSVAGVVTSWGYAALLLAASSVVSVDVTRAAIAWTISQSLGAIVAVGSSLRVAGIGRPRLALLRETTPFAFRAWAGSFSSFLNARVDQTIMGVISTERNLGIYAVAVNAGEVALYLPGAVATALLPVIAASPAGHRLSQTMRIARVLLLLTSVTVIVAAIGGWLLIPIVFGQSYADSVGPFLWLLPGTIGYSFLRVFSSSLLASGSPARSSLGAAAALVTGVCFDFVLIPAHGAPGAAIAASLAFFAGGIVATVAHRSAVGYVWRDLVPRRSDLRFIVGLLRRIVGRPDPD